MARKKKVAVDPLTVSPVKVTWHYLGALAGAVVLYLALHFFWPNDMLTSFHALWGNGVSVAGLEKVWFIFAWAFGVTLIGALIKPTVSFIGRPTLFGRGLWLSLNAGVFEEIIYRALTFMSAMVLLRFTNAISHGLIWLVTFGQVHFDLVKWLYGAIFVPLANFTTFHALQPQLLHMGVWVFGAAIISAAAVFRDQHKYLGRFGWINSWFIGMAMFYLMFNYGLLTAIVAHAVYDAIIFTLVALTAKKPSGLEAALYRVLTETLGGLMPK